MLTNIFIFVFVPKVDPKYIRIRVKKNIPNIFVFGPQKNIHYALCCYDKDKKVIKYGKNLL